RLIFKGAHRASTHRGEWGRGSGNAESTRACQRSARELSRRSSPAAPERSTSGRIHAGAAHREEENSWGRISVGPGEQASSSEGKRVSRARLLNAEDRVLGSLGDAELHDGLGSDLDFFAGLRIGTDPGFTLLLH